PYDTLQPQIKRKVENDYRAQMAHEIFFDKVKQKNNFKEYPENFKSLAAKFSKIPDTGKNANSFTPAEFSSMQAPLFSLAGKNYTQYDFVNFAASVTRGRLMGPKDAIFNDLYKLYVSNTLNDFEEHKLVEENADFRNLMEEYKDGILLFELMDRNVWGKASKDSVGLQAFYEANKSKYMWEPGFKGVVYKFKDEATMKEGVKMLNKKSTTDEDLAKHVNNENAPDAVTIQHGRYEFSRYTDVPRKDIVKGKLTPAAKAADGTYTVIKVEEVYNNATPKTLDEARGYVVAEYQDYLEKKWNEEMRKKYAMTLDTAVFNSMAKK
ncbi:MAG: peptidyl-prolyl cis-trans isomerase, partial [Bacteroidetes bacterium]|nr:peptidyl-prolyl cis-trans isomerase [Bacteroidota bacterium]